MKQTHKPTITNEYITQAINSHTWAATGVSDYPPRDPLVGQSEFYTRYRQFIRTVDQADDNFAHVFAVIGEWGRGKSRIGHELVAQINDCSRGWFVRDPSRKLVDSSLFDEETRESYLALYIRYSQIASEYQNSDNWFAYGLYKALLPLATKRFDASIQSEIARQALRRLEPMGFDHEQLASELQLSSDHSEEDLYYDDHLVTELVQAAYAYLQKFGIKYILVVLDELETVAETATFGLEQDEAKQLDGQAIRLIGRAIKEEDPRRKLPWLRYVALCSPLLGHQLREIQSVARRFELVELENNAFADVADYVQKLTHQRKLAHDYPTGLVQAAYVMSGANFGWFNVIMANIDVILDDYVNSGRDIPGVGELFEAVLHATGRVKKHVLDHDAINGIKSSDRSLLEEARSLLFGQLPVSLSQVTELTRKLVNHLNEYDEPVASLYRKVQWDSLECRRALENAKFIRNKDLWFYPSVEQGLSLSGMLENLKTFAIHEPENDALLIPLANSEFKHLVQLLYNHPAAEYAADALWQKFLGNQKQLEEEDATHIGPGIAMLLRLDLRYRSQQNTSMIFRDPDHSNKHSKAMKAYEKAAGSAGAKKGLVLQTRLTGLYRLLDRNWQYNDEPYPNRAGLTILTPSKGTGKNSGLLHCDGLKLHPKNQAWFAWVDAKEELNALHEQVVLARNREGRLPVMAFTASIGVNDYYVKGSCSNELKNDILLYHLNVSELDVMERIGLMAEFSDDLELNESVFTTRFKNRLNAIRDFAYKAIHSWRQMLSKRGLIAWPLRPTAKISEKDRQLLADSWRLLCIDEPELGGLYGLNADHAAKGIDAEALGSLFERLRNDPKVQTQGYELEEQAGLFSDLARPNQAQAHLPPFLARIANPAKGQEWTFNLAKNKWYWGYLWAAPSLNAKNIFDDWMWLASEINLLNVEETGTRDGKWVCVTLAALENTIVEAQNWLEGDGDDGYQSTVRKLEKVYGSSRIYGLFAPRGSRQEGTQTTHALESLQLAQRKFDELKVMEEQTLDNLTPEELSHPLPSVIKSRNIILQQVSSVFNKEAPPVNLENYRTVNLEDRSKPLYSRIEEARLFAERVECCDKRICEQISVLIEDMKNDPEAAPPFPVAFFTLSLKTIEHIFDGVLRQSTDGETASTESGSSSDTLLHFLRDLRIDKATERLELLGHEVGYDLASDHIKPLAEIDGYILSTFRTLKQRYLSQFNALNKNINMVEALQKKLDSPPEDYANPAHLGELASLKNVLLTVKDSFEDLSDTAADMREQFSDQARKGIFKHIADVPDRLMKPIQGKLASIGGQVNTIDLSVKAYLRKQLERANGKLIQQLETLFKVAGKGNIKLMQDADLENLTLLEAQVKVDARLQQLRHQAADILADTCVSIERWLVIAQALLENNDPKLSAEEQNDLVEKGVLMVKVTFVE